MPKDEAGRTVGFLISLRTDEVHGSILAKHIASTISDNLVVSDVDVDYLGEIDEFEDPDAE